MTKLQTLVHFVNERLKVTLKVQKTRNTVPMNINTHENSKLWHIQNNTKF